jgi:hypothetical protein
MTELVYCQTDWYLHSTLDNTVHYYSTMKKISRSRLHYFNCVRTAQFRAREEMYNTSLNIHLHLISHEELRSHFLDFAKFYTDNCFREESTLIISLHRN